MSTAQRCAAPVRGSPRNLVAGRVPSSQKCTRDESLSDPCRLDRIGLYLFCVKQLREGALAPVKVRQQRRWCCTRGIQEIAVAAGGVGGGGGGGWGQAALSPGLPWAHPTPAPGGGGCG